MVGSLLFYVINEKFDHFCKKYCLTCEKFDNFFKKYCLTCEKFDHFCKKHCVVTCTNYLIKKVRPVSDPERLFQLRIQLEALFRMLITG
jgi:hypothetical protein